MPYLLRTALFGALAGLVWRPAGAASAAGMSPFLFTDVTEAAGIGFRHYDGSSGRKYILETTCSGVGLFDYDGDGRLDIYFVNGAPLPGAAAEATPPADRLYRNEGGMRFRDVTEAAGVGDPAYGYGCVAGDYDNDGDLDLYVVNFGPNTLYRNDGDGTFTDVTAQAGVGDPRDGAAAAFLDIENDGDLDLYVANYLVVDLARHRPCSRDGVPVYCSRLDYPPERDVLYRNNGDGTFTDISQQAGITAAATGMSVACSDVDRDGFMDIFVANDAMPNFLYHNRGNGTFEEAGLYSGVAYDMNGDVQGNMAAAFGDYDEDGLFDLLTTNYQQQMVAVYRNLGGALFQDMCLATGIGPATVTQVTWGCGFWDFDNDTRPDLFVACGHLEDSIDQLDPSAHYKEENLVFRGLGGGRFANVSRESGPGLAIRKSSRGTAFGDLDNDGDIDIVILNARDRADLLRNDSVNANHWVLIRTVGRAANRDGIGARVSIASGGRTRWEEVRSGGTYAGMNDLRVHFGLGAAMRIDRITVRWPGGREDVVTDAPVDRILTITEGNGLTATAMPEGGP